MMKLTFGVTIWLVLYSLLLLINAWIVVKMRVIKQSDASLVRHSFLWLLMLAGWFCMASKNSFGQDFAIVDCFFAALYFIAHCSIFTAGQYGAETISRMENNENVTGWIHNWRGTQFYNGPGKSFLSRRWLLGLKYFSSGFTTRQYSVCSKRNGAVKVECTYRATTRTPWSGYQEAVDMISDGFDELLEGLVLKNSTREEIIEAIGDFYQPEPEIPPVTSDPKLSGVVSTIIFTVTSAKKDDNLLPGIQAFSETIFQPWKRRRIEGSKHGIYQAEILPRLIKEVKLSTTSELPWVLRALIEVDKCQEATELLFGCPLATLDNELAVRIYKALASGNHKHLFMQIPDLHSWHYQPPNYDLSIRVYPHEWLAICILGDERTELEELIKSES